MTLYICVYYDTCNVCSLVFCVQYTLFFLFSVHASVAFCNVGGHSALTDLSKDWKEWNSVKILLMPVWKMSIILGILKCFYNSYMGLSDVLTYKNYLFFESGKNLALLSVS